MKRISLILASLFALALCTLSFAKDVKISKADNDKIVTASVGDVLVAQSNRFFLKASVESGSGLCVRNSHLPSRVRKIDVEKAGKWDVKVCNGRSCYVVHIDAKEAPKK